MELRADALIAFPRDAVFVAYRDRLADTTALLPNIREIRVVSREEVGGGDVKLVNEWTGGGDIPKVARAFLSEDMLKWTDHALWNLATHEVEWHNDIHAFPSAVKAAGKNRFVDANGSTRLEIRGDFVVDAAKVPGVPRLLAKTVGPAIEKFFVAQIQLNSVAVAKAVEKLLAASG